MGSTIALYPSEEAYPMSLQSHRELEATREKLRLLEERYEANKREPDEDEHVRELSRRSLKRLINQLKEEIARFESEKRINARRGNIPAKQREFLQVDPVSLPLPRSRQN
ncbi:MAG TPA: hypothetical protein VN688_11990 [Gemmataceae bacterium]|nr:hypothetical protein [Gemmataceae bacterium]